MESVDEMKKMLRREKKQQPPKLLLGSGSTLVNLACSGGIEGAFLAGHYYFVVGDSMSGKTWLGLSCFAEASIDSKWDDYRFIYDPTEGGALMDLEKFFGQRVAERIEILDPPSGPVEEFYFNVHDQLEKKKPFLYVLDSQDSLSSVAEREKFDEVKKAHRAGKDVAGSYGDGKAKVHSANVRKLMGPLMKSGSILIVLNQTRDSFDAFKPMAYSGGRALKFYATLQLWNKVKGRIKKSVRGKQRQIGVLVKVSVKKNRMTGRERTVEVPILHSYGIDDVGSCIDYLVDEKEWSTEGKGMIEASGLGPVFKGRRDTVIAKIEQEGMVDDLKMLVQRVWDDVEKACEVDRKQRYD